MSFNFVLVFAAASAAFGLQLSPIKTTRIGGVDMERYSERTVTAAIQIDRDQAQLIAFTLKPRPYERVKQSRAPMTAGKSSVARIEIRLHGPDNGGLAVPVEVRGLCLEHGPQTSPHVEGDMVRRHREAFLVELPEVPGLDQIELTLLTPAANQGQLRRTVGKFRLTPEKFTPAGTNIRYSDVAFAERDAPVPGPLPPSTVGAIHWPEEYGDTNRYLVYGNEAQATNRINVVLIPDGYTYAQKALLEAHASNLIAYFREQTPWQEHDDFFNYTLVYAYSSEDGTDQCDCGILRDTPFATSFPYGNGICRDNANRVLSYGSGCDDSLNNYLINLSNAELRAPAWDYTIILVNTSRYGGSAGYRAVYAAGSPPGTELALHEFAHSFAGLADEYGGYASCGPFATEYNTSLDSTTGAWPEWIAELGPPLEGGQLYNFCIYRPTQDCKMRTLGEPYCPVCLQRCALEVFGHDRINPTGPALPLAPTSPLTVPVGVPINFSITTRMSSLASNTITWKIHNPQGVPAMLASNTANYVHTFRSGGRHVVSCELTADVNFIKPSKNGANYESITWEVTVQSQPTLELRSTDSAGSYQLSITNLLPGIQYFVENSAGLSGTWTMSSGFTAVSSSTNILVQPTNRHATFYRVRFSN